MTDFNRKLLVSQDWFYSRLYRDMLANFYKKQGKEVPEAITARYQRHDVKGNYRGIEEPNKDKVDEGTQTQENPQAEIGIELNPMSEPEITYQLGLFKQKMQKNKDSKLLKQLH